MHFRFVAAKLSVAIGETLETDRELDVAATDNVLDLELRKLGVETKLLYDTRVLAGGKAGVVFRFCTSNDHLARRKDEGSSLGVTNTHNDSCETLKHANKQKQFDMSRVTE